MGELLDHGSPDFSNLWAPFGISKEAVECLHEMAVSGGIARYEHAHALVQWFSTYVS